MRPPVRVGRLALQLVTTAAQISFLQEVNVLSVFFCHSFVWRKKNNDLFWDFERPSLCKSKNKVRLSAETKSTTSSLNPSIIYVGSSKCRANVPLSKYHTRISYSGPWAHWIKVMWNNLRELKKSWISWMLPLLKLYVPSAQMTKWQK